MWKINTYFQNNKILKESSWCIYLLVVLIDSVYRTSKNYYPKVFLEEYKYFIKEKKMPYCITDEITIYDFEEEHSNEER